MADDDGRSFARYFYEAVGEDPEGTVLVLDSSGRHGVSIGGGAKFSTLHNHRLAGLVTDAPLSRFLGARWIRTRLLLPRGETVRAGTRDLVPIAANVPMRPSGTTVLSGDYI